MLFSLGDRRNVDTVSHACRRPGAVLQQVPLPGPHQNGMLVFPGQLANRLAAFKRLQSIPEIIGRRVWQPFLDHRSAPPHAR